VVGVSTAYLADLRKGKKNFFYRMFIQENCRGFKLANHIMLETRNYLESIAKSKGALGMVIMTENMKFKRTGTRRYFSRHNYKLLGQNKAKQDVWRYAFI